MRIEADRERCAASGMCALTAPTVFDQDPEDGRVVLLNAHPGAEDAEAAREAVDLCPTAALSLHEDDDSAGAGDD